MTHKQLLDINTTGYEVVETTEGMNGYPKNVGCAIIGFETYEEAEQFAKEYGLEVCQLRIRDGWQFWENHGVRYEPFDMKKIRNAESDTEVYSNEDAEEYFYDQKDLLSDCLVGNDMKSYDDIRIFLDESEKNYERILNADDDEIVVFYQGNYRETLKRFTTDFRDDVWRYAIGVI